MNKKRRTLFRRLNRHNAKFTSPKTKRYNCMAWAAGETNRNWDPAPGYYWPSGIPDDSSPASGIAAFSTLGYEECGNDGSLEEGVEKIALYVDSDGDMSHAARQLSDGTWTSKIGDLQDISHDSPDLLIGGEYGEIHTFMKRRRPS